MAQAWRDLSDEERNSYTQPRKYNTDSMSAPESLSLAEKQKIIMRVAKHHQGDVKINMSLLFTLAG